MRRIAAFLAYLGLAGGILCHYRVRSLPGLLLAVPKLLACALSPFAATAGVLGTLLSLASRRRGAATISVVGALLAARYARQVTAPRGDFAAAFGPDWHRAIAPELSTRMLPRRWAIQLPDVPEPRIERDVVYHATAGPQGEPRPIRCDLWHPPAGVASTGLTFLYLHGGAWHLGDKDMHIGPPWLVGLRPLFRHLAAQGHLVVDAAYRLCPETDVDGMLADVRHAVAWVKANAARLGVDPERVVVAGDSAGGHLALLAAYTAGEASLVPGGPAGIDAAVRGVVSYYGVPDLSALCEHVRPLQGGPAGSDARRRSLLVQVMDAAIRAAVGLSGLGTPAEVCALDGITCERVLANLLGAPPADTPERLALASPLTHVRPGCPPTLLFHGSHDSLVPVASAQALYTALTRAGVPVVYNELPKTEHAFTYALPRWNPAVHAVLYDTERFLGLLA